MLNLGDMDANEPFISKSSAEKLNSSKKFPVCWPTRCWVSEFRKATRPCRKKTARFSTPETCFGRGRPEKPDIQSTIWGGLLLWNETSLLLLDEQATWTQRNMGEMWLILIAKHSTPWGHPIGANLTGRAVQRQSHCQIRVSFLLQTRENIFENAKQGRGKSDTFWFTTGRCYLCNV